jgi:AAA15 family ATPase/GTPase
MKNKISKVSIRNFKSLKSVDFSASRINLFIGKPNSGKSNLLEALGLPQLSLEGNKFLSESKFLRADTCANLFYDEDTSVPVEINAGLYQSLVALVNSSVHFLFCSWGDTLPSISERNELKAKFCQQGINLQKGVTKNSWGITARVFDIRGGITNRDLPGAFNFHVYKYDFPIRFENYSFSNGNRLSPDGFNLYEIVNSHGKIKRWLADVFIEYDLELLLDNKTRQFEIQKKQDGYAYKIPFSSTPDTVRRMLYHMAAIHSNKDAVILFEEPEAHSFPPYIDELAATIAEDAGNQYFITTHSPYLLNRFLSNVTKKGELGVFYTYWKNYQTNIRKLTEKEITSIFESGSDIFLNMDVLEHD